jgi:hypothetical protein
MGRRHLSRFVRLLPEQPGKPFVKQLIGISIAAVLRDRVVDLKLVTSFARRIR